MNEDNTYDAKLFWINLKKEWHIIYNKLMFSDEKMETVKYINTLLPDNDLEIDITTNMINNQELDSYKDYVELYISPKMKNTSINKMHKLYKCRIDLDYLIVSCYKPYYEKDRQIVELDYTTFKVKYDDIAILTTFGYNKNKPIINIVIVVKNPPAKEFLSLKKVDFYDEGKNLGSRNVWMEENYYPICIFLTNIIGEYNYMHNIGYIEILPEDDPQIKPEMEFLEIGNLKNEMKTLFECHKYPKCTYCSHYIFQVDLRSCTGCGTAKYCGIICQRADWNTHKLICKK